MEASLHDWVGTVWESSGPLPGRWRVQCVYRSTHCLPDWELVETVHMRRVDDQDQVIAMAPASFRRWIELVRRVEE